MTANTVRSQICGPSTPSFTANLIGCPTCTWTSPNVQRQDTCCGSTNPDVCVKFTIFLDPTAMGINFGIASGAVPGGSLFYQINCGPPVAAGQPICLSGTGPHILTFCKPGNNTNTYTISSIPKPAVPDSILVRNGCSATLAVSGFSVPTITWNSINPGPSGAYNSYLSCTSGCASVVVTPTGTPPPFVDYEVGGFGQSPCQASYFKDTVRVYFYNNLIATINPTLTTICFGQTSAVLTGSASGGLPAYTYSWSTGSTSTSVTVGPGTYTFTVNDKTGCPPATATAVVNSFTLPITANAGPDQLVCKTSPQATLNGAVTSATSAVWSGGSGTISPSPTSYTINYTPTPAEVLAGSVTLFFTTTGNYGCPPDQDTVKISFQNVSITSVSPSQTVCANNSTVTLAGSVTGFSNTGVWSSSGSGSFGSTTNLNTTYVPSAADISAGTVTITLTSTNNGACPQDTSSVKIQITPAPLVNAGPNQFICSTGSAALNGSVSAGATTGNWTSSGSGTFNPSSAVLSASYIPSAADISAGIVTLTLTSTNNGNCFPVTDTVAIRIKQTALVNAGPNLGLCSNAGTISLTGNVSGGTTTGIWSASGTGGFNPNNTSLNTAYNITAGDIATGFVTFTLTSTNNGPCPAVTDTVRIRVTQIANVSAGPSQTVCSNGFPSLNGTISGGTTTGIWTTSGSGTFTPGPSVLTASYLAGASDIAAGSVTLTLTSTNNGYCPAVSSNVVIGIKQIASVSAGPNLSLCSNSGSISLTGNVSGGTTTGIWNASGSGGYNPNNTTMNTSYNMTGSDILAGTVTFTLSSTNNGPCPVVSDTVMVRITQLATVNSGPNQTLCSNAGTINLAGSIISSAGTGVWSGSGTGSYNPNNSTLNTAYNMTPGDISAGFVTFTLTSSNNGACPSVSDSVRINIKQLAAVNAGPNVSLCSNAGTVSLSGSISGVTSTGFWTSNGNGSYNPNNTNLNTAYNISSSDITAGSVTFTLTSTNNGPCPAVMDTVMVSITTLASVNAGSNQNICSNTGSVNLNGIVTGVSGFGIWSSSGSGTFTPNNITLNGSYLITPTDISNGSVTFTLTSLNNGPCPAVTDTVRVRITTIASVNAGPSKVICSSTGTVALNGTVSGGTSTGNWSTNGTGPFVPGSNSLNNTYFITVSDVAAGTITFSLSSTNNGVCPSVIDTMILNIDQVATVNAGPNQNLCSNTTTLSLNGTVGGGSSTGIWSSGGTGSLIPNNTTLNPTYSITTTDINNGFVTFTLSSTNNAACPSIKDSVRINIKKLAIVNAGADQSICSTTSVVPFSGTVSAGSSTGIWSTTGSGFITPSNTSLNMNYNTTSQDATNGTVLLILTSSNNGVCPAVIDTAKLNIIIKPVLNINSDTTVCAYGNIFTASLQVTGGSGNVIWTSNGTGYFSPHDYYNPVDYNFSSADISNGFVILTVTSVNNGACGNSQATIFVNIRPVPSANFTASTYTAYIPNDPISFTNQSTNATSYYWYFGDGGFSNQTNPIHNYPTVGYYYVGLIATNSFGCKDTTEQLITVISDIQFPNVFTPNTSGSNGGTYSVNDYSNDVFFPYTAGVTEYHLMIFNRWGELIFQSRDLALGWDGYFNGKLCQQDAYVWKADIKFFDGRKYNKTGSVTLLR
jgi:gliding motility-associated-like protein